MIFLADSPMQRNSVAVNIVSMSSSAVRYRPGEALHWLRFGTEEQRKTAQQKATGVFKRSGERSFKKDIGDVAGAVWGAGHAAMTELAHRQATSTQYLLDETGFDLIQPNRSRRVEYAQVKSIRIDGDKATLELEKGSITIKPFAHLVAGRVRVPVGWNRNGIEVPYDMLLEELSARCGIGVESE
jgi:hypothetical protein